MSDSILKEHINLSCKNEHELPHKSLVTIFSADHIIILPEIVVVFFQ